MHEGTGVILGSEWVQAVIASRWVKGNWELHTIGSCERWRGIWHCIYAPPQCIAHRDGLHYTKHSKENRWDWITRGRCTRKIPYTVPARSWEICVKQLRPGTLKRRENLAQNTELILQECFLFSRTMYFTGYSMDMDSIGWWQPAERRSIWHIETANPRTWETIIIENQHQPVLV